MKIYDMTLLVLTVVRYLFLERFIVPVVAVAVDFSTIKTGEKTVLILVHHGSTAVSLNRGRRWWWRQNRLGLDAHFN